MAEIKLSPREVKEVKRAVTKMSQKELSHYLSSIYKSGYNDGLNQPITEDEQMDLSMVMIAVRATEGVGDVLCERIRTNIENLCFGGIDKK